MKLLLLWLTALLSAFVLLHPSFSAQYHDGTWIDAPELRESGWLWAPPTMTSGFRFRPDHARQSLYLASILLVATATWLTIRATRPNPTELFPAAVADPRVGLQNSPLRGDQVTRENGKIVRRLAT